MPAVFDLHGCTDPGALADVALDALTLWRHVDDEASYEERELDEGDVIAYGTTDVEGYGTTRVERAKFIVDTIRVHLAREACRLHAEDLSSIEALLGREVRWCALADEGPRVYQMIHSVCERDPGSARTCWADAGGTR